MHEYGAIVRQATPALIVVGCFAASAIAQPCGPVGGWVHIDDAGFDGRVVALLVMPDGNVIAGGGFRMAGGVPAVWIARWDGADWWPIGGAPAEVGGVGALAAMPNGDVIAGGTFTELGGVKVNNIARWDGTRWYPMGEGLEDSIYTIAVLPNGDVIAGGTFAYIPGANGPSRGLARWDGTSWTSPGNVVGSVVSTAVLTTGDLVAAGSFGSIGGVPARNIARWDGKTWSPLEYGLLGYVHTVCALDDGGVAAGGSFERLADGRPCNHIAQWHPTGWTLMHNGMESDVFTIAKLAQGHLVAGGRFFHAAPAVSQFVAEWTGTTWQALGSGTDQFVYALAQLPASRGSEILVGGQFDMAGGEPSPMFARYSRTGRPWFARGPQSARACDRAVHVLHAQPASGYSNLDFLWRRNGMPLEDGETPWGSTIEGALTNTITITNAGPDDAGLYDCFLANPCGVSVTRPAELLVCAADVTCDGAVTSQDFFDFLARFFAGHPHADVDRDGQVISTDFFGFLEAFFNGC